MTFKDLLDKSHFSNQRLFVMGIINRFLSFTPLTGLIFDFEFHGCDALDSSYSNKWKIGSNRNGKCSFGLSQNICSCFFIPEFLWNSNIFFNRICVCMFVFCWKWIGMCAQHFHQFLYFASISQYLVIRYRCVNISRLPHKWYTFPQIY